MRERVQISYRGGNHGHVTERLIDPYGLARLGPWYVVAYCQLRNDLRTFRIDRVRNIRSASDRFTPPERVDADGVLEQLLRLRCPVLIQGPAAFGCGAARLVDRLQGILASEGPQRVTPGGGRWRAGAYHAPRFQRGAPWRCRPATATSPCSEYCWRCS